VRIALVADPYIPVPPVLYGGIERIIGFLVSGLRRRGHEVTLVAHPASTIECDGLVGYGRPPHDGRARRARELVAVQRALTARARRIDVVHSFGRLAGLLPLLPARWIPKVQSYQRAISWPGVRRASRLGGRSLVFTACSSAMYRSRPPAVRGRCDWLTVFNGVELGTYDCATRVDADAPLVFLGQVHPMKGPQAAIAIARAAGRRLVIAGAPEPGEKGRRFFEQTIAPSLGPDVEFVGALDDAQKNALLGRAAALLFPSFYDEAFGIVMAEAMACGTPVVALDNGSVSEVVEHGRTGFVCRNQHEAVSAIDRLPQIDRSVVRSECETRFGADVIVDAYERLYASLVLRVSPRRHTAGICAES
jgi:glycosyltransferase involved in cell wall biosynthesis